MRALALVFALLSAPAFAADHTPWPGRAPAPIASEWTELAQQGADAANAARRGSPAETPALAQRASARARRDVRAEALWGKQ
jgi:hypothetical protein